MKIHVIEVADVTAVAVLRESMVNGCTECIRARLEAYNRAHNGRAPVSRKRVNDLLQDLQSQPFHGQAEFIITNLVGDTPTISTPIDGCVRCANVERMPTDFASNLYQVCVEDEPNAHHHGGIRLTSSSKFVERNSWLIGATGILTEPVEQANSPSNARFANALQLLSARDGYDVAGGKGATFTDALASCVGEGLERYFLTGVYDRPEIVASATRLGDQAVDPMEEWGFPVTDNHPALTAYDGDLPILWAKMEVLADPPKSQRLVPADMVYSPPKVHAHARNITAGSTNGTAAGAAVPDATLQALLELTERDAYWFYMRTRNRPRLIPLPTTPEDVQAIAGSNPEITYIVEALDNPFRVPVCQVLAEDRSNGSAVYARGTGAMTTESDAIRRAFNECNQMLTSLRTGANVDPHPDHMRALWYHGEARDAFPNVFLPDLTRPANVVPLDELDPLGDLVSRLSAGGAVFRRVLVETSSFAIVKCLASSIGNEDPFYYSKSSRLESFARSMNLSPEPSHYTETLFM